MKHKRVFVLCSLVMALALSLSIPAMGAYAGEATNLTEDGICYWKCYSPRKVGSGPATTGSQCLSLCANACHGPCLALY